MRAKEYAYILCRVMDNKDTVIYSGNFIDFRSMFDTYMTTKTKQVHVGIDLSQGICAGGKYSWDFRGVTTDYYKNRHG